MVRIIAIILVLFLAGCAGPQKQILVRDRFTVVAPPDALYNCPELAKYPDPEKLTDVQVARLIQKLDENNRICGVSVRALKKFYQNAKRKYQ